MIHAEGLELLIIPIAPWSMNILPVATLDLATGNLQTAIPCTYAPARPLFGDFPEGSAWLENDLGLISKRGHWAVNWKEKRIYLWPTGDTPGENILAPSLVEFVSVAGKLDQAALTDQPVRNLHFRGLTFMHGDRYTVPLDRTGLGVQHDWEQFDQPTAALRFRGAEECSVQDCTFSSLGGTAIRLDLHCQRIPVLRNQIHDVGGTGIFLCGYGPGTKDVNHHNRVEDNDITRVGRHYWDSPAIFIWQSGQNSVAHNRISQTPYAGIVVSGRIVWDSTGKQECSRTLRWDEIAVALQMDPNIVRNMPEPDWTVREQFLHARGNRIEKNDISHVVEIMSDGNGIYISGAGGNNLVEANFIHDIPSKNLTEAIRCDDDQHQTRIKNNVICRFGGYATAIASKGINDIMGNLIFSPLRPSVRGLISLELGPVVGSCIRDNVVVANHAETRPIFQERSYGDGPIPRLADCDADHNLYWNVADPKWAEAHLDRERKLGVERNSHTADPGFVDLENGDFEIRADSCLPELGFAVPDVSDAGPRIPVGKKSKPAAPRKLAAFLLALICSISHVSAAGELIPDPPLANLRVEHFQDTTHHWAQRHITELVDRGVITGATAFAPEEPILRADLMKWARALFGQDLEVKEGGTNVTLATAQAGIQKLAGDGWMPPLTKYEDTTQPLRRGRAAEWLLSALQHPSRFSEASTKATVYVSPLGKDTWSGSLAEPSADGLDGPVATPAAARDRLRVLRKDGSIKEPTVLFRSGRYELDQTLDFTPEDGGKNGETIVYKNYGNEEVVLSGGVEVTGWTLQEKRAEGDLWKAAAPSVVPSVRQLFANNQRLPRARFPDTGFLRVVSMDSASLPKRFNLNTNFPNGKLQATGAEFVNLSYWSSRREMIVRSGENWVEGATHVGSAPFGLMMPAPGNSAFIENDPSLLNQPWEWCFVPETKELLLMTPSGHKVSEIHFIAPRIERLIRISGSEKEPCQNIRFQGIAFAHSAATMPKAGISEFQATFYNDDHSEKEEPNRVDRLYTLPPAVEVSYATGIVFSDVRLVHLGNQGINFGEGARHNSIIGSQIADIGATGIMIGAREVWGDGAAATDGQDGRGDWSRAAQVPYGNTVSDNEIYDCGRIVFGGVGIWTGYTKFTTISNNDVFRLPYTGISVGWSFKSCMTSMEYPRIENNHVRDVMRILTDGGGIYLLGYQPGGVMRGNIIHDVWRNSSVTGFFAHGLYFDEASRFWTVEQNQVFDTFDDLHFNNFLRNPKYQNVDFNGNAVELAHRIGGEDWLNMRENRFGDEPPVVITAGVRPEFRKKRAPDKEALFQEQEPAKERIIGEKEIGNGGFEQDALSGWRSLSDGHGKVSITKNPKKAKEGSGFLTLTRANYADPILSNPLALKKGKTYHLRSWIRLAGGAPTTFRVYVESFGLEILKNVPVTPGEWVLLETDFTVSKNTNSALVFQTLDGATGITPIDLDEVSVKEVSP